MSRPEDKYYLFLMEVFVKRVSSDRLAKLNQMFAVPTVVHFEFLDFADEDLTVTPADPLDQSRSDVTIRFEAFNSGKSVLFPLDYNEVANCTAEMILNFAVKKQMTDNIIPKSILVGTGTLNLSKQYLALRKEMLKCWGADFTTSTKELEAEVPLIYNQYQSGTLHVFVKLSGYGETIVTEFDEPITQDFSTSLFGTGETATTDRIVMHDYRKLDSSVIDLCEASSKNLQELFNYPANMLESYPCPPCGKEKMIKKDEESKFDDRMPDLKLKDVLSKSSQSSRSQFCKPVVLKVSGLFDNGDNGCKKPTVTVAAEPDVTKPDDVTSSQHDIFVLRIGKKGLVGVNEKSDIQLEMKTPKGSERRPPIRYETRDIQTDLEAKEPLDRRRDDTHKKKHRAKKKEQIRTERRVK